MKQIVEAMTAMIFLLILCITGMELMNAQMQTERARECRMTIARVLEQSAFDEKVAKECIEKAKEQGYDVSIEFLMDDGGKSVWNNVCQEALGEVVLATIHLRYFVEIPILHSEVEHNTYATVG